MFWNFSSGLLHKIHRRLLTQHYRNVVFSQSRWNVTYKCSHKTQTESIKQFLLWLKCSKTLFPLSMLLTTSMFFSVLLESYVANLISSLSRSLRHWELPVAFRPNNGLGGCTMLFGLWENVLVVFNKSIRIYSLIVIHKNCRILDSSWSKGADSFSITAALIVVQLQIIFIWMR